MDMAFVAPPSGHQQQQQQHRQLHHHHHPAAAFHPYVDGSGQLPQQHHHQYGVNGNPSMPPQMTCDIKPRLTKEQHDILESHFQKQNKPSTNTKKGFAETLNVSLDKVNVSNAIATA